MKRIILPKKYYEIPDNPEESDQFGTSLAISGDYIVVGAPYEDTTATDAGSAYIYHRNGATWNLVQHIQANDPEAYDYFGYSVAISGDYIVVGAYGEDTGGTDAGSAYIYHRNGTTWDFVQHIQADVPEASDQFGNSVAIDGDYIVVGSPYEDTGGSSAGSAYIYHRTGSTWDFVQHIQADDPEQGDQFGWSVAISGDYIVVGANAEDTGETKAGSAYIYHRNGTAWDFVQHIQANNAEEYDYFGWSVAISGDYIVVGSPYEDTKANGAGSAYIYRRTSSTWNFVQQIQADNPGEGDYFGWSVAISGDYIVVGADGEDTAANGSGSAYIYHRNGATWSLVQQIQADDPEQGDYFGTSVAIDGDYIVVGANAEDTAATDAGSAYIYHRNGATWNLVEQIQSDDQ